MKSLLDDFDIELTPCAVCGSQPVLRRLRGRNRDGFCYECNGDCWARTHKHGRKDDAAKEWNAMQYNRMLEGNTEASPHYDRDTALAVLKEFARDMYVGYDIFGNKELRISTREFEAIRKKYLG